MKKTKINEKFYPYTTGDGGYFKDDNYKENHLYYDEVNKSEELFNNYVKLKKVTDFANRHNFGLFAYRGAKSARAYYLGSESYYNNDNIFYIKFPNEEKYRRTQLRISNHFPKYQKWEENQSIPYECDTCLNIQIGNMKREGDLKERAYDYQITIVNIKYDEEKQSEEVKENVFNFIKNIKEGIQLHVTLDDLKKIFNSNVEVYNNGNGGIRSSQYIERNNTYTIREKIPPFPNFRQKEINLALKPIPESIPLDKIDVKNVGDKFEYEGREYVVQEKNGELLGVTKVKRSGREVQKEIPLTENKIYCSSSKLIKLIQESIIKNLFK